jgi:16S rRNA (guanine966-N2)-methyltransferase
VRIIAGKYKSRKIFSSRFSSGKKQGYRPTSDSVKEALFNILSNRISFEGIKCLDLFAGSGSLGFECISRGAELCDFVDDSNNSVKLVAGTSESLDCIEHVNIFKQDAIDFLKENDKVYYDLILADPPYAYGSYEELIALVLKRDFGVFVIEYEAGNTYNVLVPEGIEKLKRKVGLAEFEIFTKE